MSNDEERKLFDAFAKRLREQLPNDEIDVTTINGKIHVSVTPRPESIYDLMLPNPMIMNQTYGIGTIVGEHGEYHGIDFIPSKRKYKNRKDKKYLYEHSKYKKRDS